MSGFLQQASATITVMDRSNNGKLVLDQLMSIVKESQTKYGGKTELATEQDPKIARLCLAWERVLCHGVKTTSSLLKNVSDFIAGQAIESPCFWNFAYLHLSNHEKERFSSLRHVWTDRGKTVALLRAALNERSLERYVLVWLNDPNLKSFYDDWALMRDNEATHLLPSIAAGLGSILFAVTVDCPEVNVATIVTEPKAEPIISTPHPADAPVRPSKSTKRKIISFDNDDETASVSPAMSACGSMPKSLSSMCLKYSETSSGGVLLPGNDPNEPYPVASTTNQLVTAVDDVYLRPESPSAIKIIEQPMTSSTMLQQLLYECNAAGDGDGTDDTIAKSQSDSGLTEETFGSSTRNTSSTRSSKHSSMHSSMESVKSSSADTAELKLRLQETLDRCQMLENRVAELSL